MSVFLFVKYILTLVMPFFLALCLLLLLQPLLEWLEQRLHLRKRVLAATLLTLTLCGIGALLWIGGTMLCGQMRYLTEHLEYYEECFCCFVHTCCSGLEQRLGMDAKRLEQLLYERAETVTQEMKNKALPGLMRQMVFYAGRLGKAMGFLLITLLATLLLAKDYQRIREGLQDYPWFQTAVRIGKNLTGMVRRYLKAQSIILCMISAVCVAGLGSAGIAHGIMAGILAGLLDALPFIGTGCVLVPVAFWQLIQGNLWKCVWVLLLYGGCMLIRELLEPKLLGEGLGLYPVVVLLAIYVGIQCYGLSGVILGPFSFLLIREIYKNV